MAQAIPSFPAAAVRENLRIPMRMGLPADPARWPEFVTEAISTTAETDSAGVPWDPAQARQVEPTSARPVCAMEWRSGGPDRQNFGSTEPAEIVFTLLDEEWAQVEGFSYVNVFPTLTGDAVRFYFVKILQALSLDTVGVWQVLVSTEDTQ